MFSKQELMLIFGECKGDDNSISIDLVMNYIICFLKDILLNYGEERLVK